MSADIPAHSLRACGVTLNMACPWENSPSQQACTSPGSRMEICREGIVSCLDSVCRWGSGWEQGGGPGPDQNPVEQVAQRRVLSLASLFLSEQN